MSDIRKATCHCGSVELEIEFTDGLQNIFSNGWWLIYPPGLMIFLSVIAVNAIGEGVVGAMERS